MQSGALMAVISQRELEAICGLIGRESPLASARNQSWRNQRAPQQGVLLSLFKNLDAQEK